MESRKWPSLLGGLALVMADGVATNINWWLFYYVHPIRAEKFAPSAKEQKKSLTDVKYKKKTKNRVPIMINDDTIIIHFNT